MISFSTGRKPLTTRGSASVARFASVYSFDFLVRVV